MALTPRTVRNKWFKDDDGVQTRVVDQDDHDLESIDLTDVLNPTETITAAVFENISGLTLGTPTISGGVVSFTVTGSGEATLVATLSLPQADDYLGDDTNDPRDLGATLNAGAGDPPWANCSLVTSGGPGVGAGASEAVLLNITGDDMGAITGLAGLYVEATYTTGVVQAGPLVWNEVGQYYDTVLLSDISAALDGAVPTTLMFLRYVTPPIVTREKNFPLRFVDPSTGSTDY